MLFSIFHKGEFSKLSVHICDVTHLNVEQKKCLVQSKLEYLSPAPPPPPPSHNTCHGPWDRVEVTTAVCSRVTCGETFFCLADLGGRHKQCRLPTSPTYNLEQTYLYLAPGQLRSDRYSYTAAATSVLLGPPQQYISLLVVKFIITKQKQNIQRTNDLINGLINK